MAKDLVESLMRQLGGPRDGALLRFSLANAWLQQKNLAAAVEELNHALRFDPLYSAAWKILGRTLTELGQNEAAATAFRSGITAAKTRGDKQAEKEMMVFLRRLERQG